MRTTASGQSALLLLDVIGVLEVSNNKVNAGLLKELIVPYGKECAARLQALLKEYPLS